MSLEPQGRINPVRAWRWATDIGDRPGLSLEQSKRLRLVNQVAVFTGALTAPYALFFLFMGIYPAAVICLCALCVYFATPWMQYRGYTRAATPLLLVNGNLHISSIAWLIGGDAGVQFFLVAAAMSPFLYYSADRLRRAAGFAVFSFLLYLLVSAADALGKPAYQLPALFEMVSYHATFIANFIAVVLFTFYQYHENGRVEETLNEERERADGLLLNILPEPIAERLKNGESPIADWNENVSILFADLVGFTPLSESLSARQSVELLNSLYTRFDEAVARFGLEKIRTIGDNYFVASGLPLPRPDHAVAAVELALSMLRIVDEFEPVGAQKLQIRIGVNSGSAVAGVIGVRKFQYDLWSDTVNTASRMESHGVPGKVQVSETTYALIKEAFDCSPRGEIEVKGKGLMRTWFAEARIALA